MSKAPPPRWSAAEAEEILRRAIELQSTDETPHYSDDDLARLGEEIGVTQLALRQAMMELRAKQLATPSQTPDLLDQVFGPRWFVAYRSVPGPRRAVADVLVKAMQDQLFRVQRNFGNTVVFVSGAGWMEPVRRALEVERRQYLALAEVVMITVTDTLHRSNWVDVRIEAGMPTGRRQRLHSAGLNFGATAGASTLLAMLVTSAPLSWPLLACGLVVGGVLAEHQRRAYALEVAGMRANLERFLDYLEHERT